MTARAGLLYFLAVTTTGTAAAALAEVALRAPENRATILSCLAVGVLAGAGAWAAQRIADRRERRLARRILLRRARS